MTPAEAKRRLRATLSAFAPPSPATRAEVVAQVSRWLEERRPRVVVGFLAMGDEIDMTPLVGAHPEIRFALTRTAPGVTLTVHDFEGPREMHRFGFEQPAAEAARIDPEDVDVVLVPGLAFAPDGRRLGRGAGYYDRFLATVDAVTVALTTTNRMRSDIPLEPHDVRVGWIATEEGVTPATGAPRLSRLGHDDHRGDPEGSPL